MTYRMDLPCSLCGATPRHRKTWCRECGREQARIENAERRAQKREWERRWVHSARGKAVCKHCGGPCGAGSHRPSRAPDRCSACVAKDADQKAREVVRLWAEGKRFPEIQAAMGWTKGHLSAALNDYRAAGYDLPYRNQRRAA